ncbi:hypothetical protein A9X04_00340 [Mycobacterium sp. E3247]|nr:hypothetical protein A9X04_00340 [Mycobacterium sp. E3247]
MTVTEVNDIRYDPYDVELLADPYPMFRRLREESPLYYFCLGAALARLEARIALEEILKRFPEWDIDTQNAHLSSASAVRGWESMPAFI